MPNMKALGACTGARGRSPPFRFLNAMKPLSLAQPSSKDIECQGPRLSRELRTPCVYHAPSAQTYCVRWLWRVPHSSRHFPNTNLLLEKTQELSEVRGVSPRPLKEPVLGEFFF